MSGLYFDQFEVGQVISHSVRRTVTEMDNVLFSAMTHNPAPLHIDEDYCQKNTQFGRRIVNSAFTLGLVVGVSVQDTTLGTTVGNLGFEEVRFPAPVFHGDTLHAETEVISVRDSKSRPENGIVLFEHRGYNQNDELIATIRRAALMRKKP
ncbi:MaoC family dehydratase [Achromobacter piechaudii]|uniref:Mesaconyl-CoA hydratase n=1 Tax=Achromobacter piechaudii TaxID=72556 RepID=A0A6S7CVP6_9BURK|nr:MaoC family dehydratase [Achromobacter piechaudii]CAB3867676.1 Mesaconyl-CoA hydratase [Achromobacter piechaudii]